MNERIKQLWDKANLQWKDEFEQASEPRECRTARDIFAELIVRECAKTVEVYIHDSLYNGLYERGYNDGRNASALLIKQHFGVEE